MNELVQDLEAITKGCVERSAWPTIYDLCRHHFKYNDATSTAMADAYTYGEGRSVRSRFAIRYDLQIKQMVNESLRKENEELTAEVERLRCMLRVKVRCGGCGGYYFYNHADEFTDMASWDAHKIANPHCQSNKNHEREFIAAAREHQERTAEHLKGQHITSDTLNISIDT